MIFFNKYPSILYSVCVPENISCTFYIAISNGIKKEDNKI